MNTRNQVLAAWGVPVAMVLFGLSLVSLGHFIPPPPPTRSAEEVAAFFHEHSVGIRLGMTLFLFSGTLLAPITAVFAVLIRRIEGVSPILTYTQIITGTVALVLFIPPAICWTVAAYRPERAISEILLLNDLGWFFFIMTVPPGILQVLVLGMAILQDKRRQPLFPRWVGYFNLWAAVIFIPGGVVSLFKTGPFAWNGIIAFWIPVLVFGSWWWVMFVVCLKAIRRPDETIPAPVAA
jgi:hypothetical protein